MSSVMRRPDEKHKWAILKIDNDGENYLGTSWMDLEDTSFEYEKANPLFRFLDAPKGKAFIVYSVHAYWSTIHISQQSADALMSNMNMDLTLQACPESRYLGSDSPYRSIFHTRIYYNKTQPTGRAFLVSNGDFGGTNPVSIKNPLAYSDWRHYDPEPHFVYPHGIYVGQNLKLIWQLGTCVNMNEFTPSATLAIVHIEYEIVERKPFEKLFGLK